MDNTLAIAAYIDSIQRDYPFGIPRSALVAGGHPQLIFIGEVPGALPTEPFRGPGGELLRAAITKGMKLDLAQVSVIVLPLADGGSGLALILKDAHPRCIVCLGKAGSEALAGVGEDHGVKDVVVTADLAAVLSSVEAKRAFWEDLKRVIGIL